MYRIASFAALALCLFACNANPPHENPFDEETPRNLQARAKLHGSARLEVLGTAADHAGIRVEALGTNFNATTDAAGEYVINEVPAATYTLVVSREGFEPETLTGVTVTLDDGEKTVEVGQVTLRVARGELIGQVALADARENESLSGVEVALNNNGGSTRTDPEGRFALSGLPAGSYDVTLSALGYKTRVERGVVIEGRKTTDLAAAAPLQLESDPGNITGRVAVRGSADSSGVSVGYEGTTLRGAKRVSQPVTTGADGAFDLGAVPAGVYNVSFSRSGYVSETRSVSVSPGTGVELAAVELLWQTGSARGRATLRLATGAAPADSSGIQVTLTPAPTEAEPTPAPAAIALTDASGAWQVEALPVRPDPYVVSFYKSGFRTVTGSATVVEAQWVEVADALLEELPATVTGSVSLEGGADPTGVAVSVEGTSVSAAAAADGSFLLTPIPPGTRTLLFQKDATFETARQQVVLAPDQQLALPAVSLPLARGVVYGRLRVDGRPADASGVRVVLSDATRALSAETDVSGAFRIERAPVGTWSLNATLEGYSSLPTATVTVAPGVEVEAPPASAPDAERTLQLRRDARLEGLVIYDQGGASQAFVSAALSGRDVTGQPVSQTELSDSSGRFNFEGLAAGTYRVTLALQGYETRDLGSWTLAAGESLALPEALLERSRGTLRGLFALEGMTDHWGILVRAVEADLSTVTDGTGSFRLAGVPVGTYTLEASKPPDYEKVTLSVQVERNQETAVLEQPAGTAHVLAVVRTAAVTGGVTLEGAPADLSGVDASLSGTDFRGKPVLLTSTSAPDGAFSFGPLASGTYAVSLSHALYRSASTARFDLATGASLALDPLALSARRGRVIGHARAGGVARAGIAVQLTGTGTIGLARDLRAQTDSTGAFAFDEIPLGSYTLAATLDGYLSASASVTVGVDGADADAGTLDLALDPGTLQGTVHLEDDADPTQATVSVDGAGSVTPLANGTFSLPGLPAGDHTVRARADGFVTATATVRIQAGQTTSLSDPLELQRARGTVVGRVDAAGQGSDGGVLVTVERNGLRLSTTTATDGSFRIAGIPAGSGYLVRAEKDGFEPRVLEGVTVAASAVTDVGVLPLARATGDFAFLHCQNYLGTTKQRLSTVGRVYAAACPAAAGPRVRLELSPSADVTRVRWTFDPALTFAAGDEKDWDPSDPPEVALTAGSGTKTLYLQYFSAGTWSSAYSANLFVDLELPLLDVFAITNAPRFLTRSSTTVQLFLKAHDAASGSEPGSGVKYWAVVFNQPDCSSASYQALSGSAAAGLTVSAKAIDLPDAEPEGLKSARLCLRDAAGNDLDPALPVSTDPAITNDPLETIAFDRTPPVASALAFYPSREAAPGSPLTRTNLRSPVLRATVSATFAPLAGVAFSQQSFDCATASFEPPDVLSSSTSGDQTVYQLAKDWTLSGADGTKRAFLCVRDQAGNASSSPIGSSPDVELDTTPPSSCSLQLAGGRPAVNAREVAVALGSSDTAGEVFLSGDVQAAPPSTSLAVNAWVSFEAAPAKKLLLSDLDGLKTVSLRCRDQVGNESASTLAAVALDRVAPTGALTLELGSATSRDSTVDVAISASDDRSGLARMKLANDTPPDCSSASGWEAFAPTRTGWPLSGGEGSRTVHACLQDGAGNVALAAADSIAVDLTNPTGTLAINGGDAFTASPDVTLSLTASADVTDLKVSNSSLACATVTAWNPFQEHLAHRLSCAEGPCTVWVCLRDASGRTTELALQDAIDYDPSAPTVTSVAFAEGDFVNGTSATLAMSVSYAAQMRLTGPIAAIAGGLAPGEWVAVLPSVVLTLEDADGPKTVNAQFRDAAGNQTPTYSDTITIDRGRPTGTLLIDAGADYTRDRTVALTIAGSDDASGLAAMKLAVDSAPDCAGADGWQGFAAAVDPYDLPLTALEGSHTVWACLRDRAGNATLAAASDAIWLDLTDPSGTVSLNAGEAWTTDATVSVSLAASADVTQMKVSETSLSCASVSDWMPFQSSLQRTLGCAAGQQCTLFVCLKDASGRTSSLLQDAIGYDPVAPTVSSFALPGGDYTRSTAATLVVAADGADEMRISGPIASIAGGFSPDAWIPFAASRALTLTAGDGPKTVSAQFRDLAGNTTSAYSYTVTLDTVPPAGSLAIAGGADYTQSATVSLTLTGSDDRAGLARMKLASGAAAPDCSAAAGWGSWAASVPAHSLTQGEGVNTVWACLEDRAGNVTATAFSDQITLDLQDPDGSVTLAGGAAWTSSAVVQVALGASADVTQMKLSESSMTCSAVADWAPFQASLQHTLGCASGQTCTVYVCLRDAAGRVSDLLQDSIAFDDREPTGASIAFSGPDFTRSTSASLLLAANGATEMRLSGPIAGGVTPDAWIPFNSPQPLTLTAGDGPKTVSVQFRDDAGNTTDSFSDTVTLDTAAPTGTLAIAAGADYTQTATVALALAGADDRSGVWKMKLANGPAALDCSATTGWIDFASSVAAHGLESATDGQKSVLACFMDRAGNTTAEPVSDAIVLDRADPDGTVSLEAGAAWTRTASVTVGLTASSDVTQMKVAETTMTCSAVSDWVPFQSSLQRTLGCSSGQSCTVFVCLKDAAGRTSGLLQDSISYDAGEPTVSAFALTGGDYTRLTSATLAVTSDASEMRLSGPIDAIAGGFAPDTWIPFATSRTLTLTAGDGPKTVSAQFRDAAGNTTSVYSDTVTLDTVAPSGSVTIAGGAAYTTSASVALALAGNDDRSGVALMKLADGAAPDCAEADGYASFAAAVAGHALQPAGEGTKTVWACFQDRAGNSSAQAVSDEIFLDLGDPAADVGLNGGDDYTASLDVTVSFANASADLAQMKVSNGSMTCSSLTAWDPYQASSQHRLSCSSGQTCTVYVCLKDAAGRISGPLQDSIGYDVEAPTVGSFAITGAATAEYAASTAASLSISVNGATQMRLSGDLTAVAGGVVGEWMGYATAPAITLSGGDGLKTVTAQFRDEAGNVTAPVSDSVTLDTANPTLAVSLNNDAAWTSSSVVTLQMSASVDVVEMAVANGLVSGALNCATASYQPFSPVFTYSLVAPGADQTNYVDVCVRDRARRTVRATDGIGYDATAPAATALVIESGADSTLDARVDLTSIQASGASEMYLDGDVEIVAGLTFEWIPYASQLVDVAAGGALPLTQSDGLKIVRVRFRDEAGNVSSSISDFVTLDTQAPGMSSVTVDEGEITNEAAVALTLFASDAVEMCIVGDVAVSGVAHPASEPLTGCPDELWWQAYTTALADGAVTLTKTDDWNQVTVLFRDASGNVSLDAPATDRIYLDQTRPAVSTAAILGRIADGQLSTSLSGTADVTLGYSVNGGEVINGEWFAGRPPAEMAFVNYDCASAPAPIAEPPAGSCLSASFDPFAHTKSWTLSVGDGSQGRRCVAFCFKDEAGNLSLPVGAAINLDLVAPEGPAVQVLGGDWAVSPSVTLALGAENGSYGATQYFLEGTLVNDAKTFQWVSASLPATVAVSLSATEGQKVVLARFRDAAGNVTATAVDQVTLDGTAPATPAMEINGGAPYTNSASVTLGFAASESPAVMHLRNLNESDPAPTDCTAGLGWVTMPYAPSVRWELGGSDGTWRAAACFEDQAGNRTAAPVLGSIVLDTRPPQVTAFRVVPSGIPGSQPDYFQSADVSLQIGSPDASQMRIAGDLSALSVGGVAYNAGEWIAFSTSAQVTLADSGTGGQKTLTLQLRDAAFNETPAQAVNVTLDVANPSVTVQLDGGATYASTEQVSVSLLGLSSDVVEMALSDSASSTAPNCSAASYQPLAAVTTYTLTSPAESAYRYVHACVRDRAGRTATAWDRIYYDSVAPGTPTLTVASGAVAGFTSSPVLSTFRIDATGTPRAYFIEGGVQVSSYTFRWITQSTWPANLDGLVSLVATQGPREVRVKVRDAAGNESYPAATTIVFDDVPPTIGSFSVEAGAAVTNTDLVDLTLAAEDATSGASKMRFSRCSSFAATGCGTTGWVPYAGSYSNYDATDGAGGIVTVYAQVQDQALNATTASDAITYDVTAPTLTSIQLRAGSTATEFTPSGQVRIYLTYPAQSASELSAIRFAEDPPGLSGSSWLPWSVTQLDGALRYVQLNLSPGDGLKTALVEIRDEAGNVGTARSDTITLDTQAPQVLAFATASQYVTSTTVAFTAAGSDTVSAAADLDKCLHLTTSTGCSTCSAWSDLTSSFSATLALTADAWSTVGLCLKDQAGNVTPVATQLQLFHDTAAPTDRPVLGVPVVGASSVTLNWTAVADAEPAGGTGSGIDHYDLQYSDQYDPTNPVEEDRFVSPVTLQVSGTTASLTDLTPSTTWYFRVRAVDRAGRTTTVYSNVQQAVPGFMTAVLADQPYVDATGPASYAPYFDGERLWVSTRTEKNRIGLLTCAVEVDDCRDRANWTLVEPTAYGEILTADHYPIVAAGDYLFVGAVINHTTYGGPTPTIWACNLKSADCTIGSSWRRNYLSTTGTAAAHLSLGSNRNLISAVWGETSGTNVGLNYRNCFTSGADCVTTNNNPVSNWETTVVLTSSSTSEDAYGSRVGLYLEDKGVYVIYRDNEDDLRLSFCSMFTDCNAAADFPAVWTFKLDDVTGINSGLYPRIVAESDSRHATWLRDTASGYQRMIATCTGLNCASAADIDDWTVSVLETVTYDGPRDLSMSGGVVRMTWRDPASAQVKMRVCPTGSTACGEPANWTPAVSLDSGYMVGEPMVTAFGPNPLVTMRDGADRVRLYQPIAPAPARFAVAPVVNGISATWRGFPFLDGYRHYYGPSLAQTEANQVYLPDPLRTGSEVDLGASGTSTYSKMVSLLDGDHGAETAAFETVPFGAYTVKNVRRATYEVAACMNVDRNRVYLAYANTSGYAYLKYCDLDADCTQTANWIGTYFAYSATFGVTACSIASDAGRILVAFNQMSTLGVAKKVAFCDDFATSGCDATGDWTTETLSDGSHGASTLSAGRAGLADGWLVVAYRNTTTDLPHIKKCNATAGADECGVSTNWSSADLDAVENVTNTDAKPDTFDMANYVDLPYSANLRESRMTLVHSGTSGTDGTMGLRICWISDIAGSTWTCQWALTTTASPPSRVRINFGNYTTQKGYLLWREDTSNRLMSTYCIESVANKCTQPKYWITVPIAKLGSAIDNDYFDMATDLSVQNVIYAAFLNRGTLSLAAGYRSLGSMFDPANWNAASTLFDTRMLAPAGAGSGIGVDGENVYVLTATDLGATSQVVLRIKGKMKRRF